MKYLRKNCRLVSFEHKEQKLEGYLLDIIRDSDGDINYVIELKNTREIKCFYHVILKTID